MYAYCVGELRMSEDGAYRRITAARAARRFPAIFEAVAKSRLHLTAVSLLAPHLTEDTAAELLAAATHKSKSEIERLLAERFPRADMLAWVAAIPTAPAPRSDEQHASGWAADQLAPGRVAEELRPGSDVGGEPADQLVPERVDEPPMSQVPGTAEHQHAPGHVDVPPVPGRAGEHSRVKPLSPQSFAIQFTASRNGHDKLRYAQEPLGHQVSAGDIAQVYELALDALIPQLEQRKFAATERPRTGPRGTATTRCIPPTSGAQSGSATGFRARS